MTPETQNKCEYEKLSRALGEDLANFTQLLMSYQSYAQPFRYSRPGSEKIAAKMLEVQKKLADLTNDIRVLEALLRGQGQQA